VPGDVIATGTPAADLPQAGLVELEVEKIGLLRNHAVDD
jgi:2-keto-4-pentenoate hydratase/2-oxohepta-3-ene-1,7-dioic acid hydratase in catechol pathway